MDSMLFIIAIFVSIFLATIMVVHASIVRKLREEVNALQEENKKLKDENHRLDCSEHSLLWQKQNLRNEILRLISDAKYYYEKKEFMYDNFKKVGVYQNGRQTMPFNEAWIIAIKMIYNWS
jgi:hypothetical protein